MHNAGGELPRILLPRTPVHKPLIERVIRKFIANSSPYVPLLSVSSTTRLDNESLQASHHNQQRLPIAVRLLAQGSIVVLVVAFGWWRMWNLGIYTLASQSDSLIAERDPIYVLGVRYLIRSRRARREGVLARAKAVLGRASLPNHLPPAGRWASR